MTAVPVDTSGPVVIEVSAKELAEGVPSPETLYKAVTAFMVDGLIVLKDVIPLDKLEALNKVMSKEAFDLVSRPTTHQNFAKTGNINQVPNLSNELLFPEIYANPIAGHILAAVLGPSPEVRYLHGNTALRGETRQPVHADLGFEHPSHVFAVAANVMLVDANVENGSTEIWLGTARDTMIEDHVEEPMEGGTPGYLNPQIKPSLLEERAKVRPPLQPFVPRGSIILRDLRLWHAGKPNQTDVPRCMLAMVHFAKWYGNRLTLKFPEAARPIIESWKDKTPVEFCVEYQPDEGFDHLALQFDANFSSKGGHPGAPIFG